jgi:hypothetical protein
MKGKNMQRRMRQLLAALAGISLLVTGMTFKPATAQTNTAGITGTVTTTNGAPITGATVDLLQGSTVIASRGSINGTVTFSAVLPAGSFNLRATIPAAGTSPAVVSALYPVVTTAGTITVAPNISVTAVLPLLYGRFLVNGAPFALGSTMPFGGMDWTVSGGVNLRQGPSTSVVSVGLSDGYFSARRPSNADFVSMAVFLTGIAGTPNAGQQVYFQKTIPNSAQTVDTDLGITDFAAATHTFSFDNADGTTPVTGHLILSNITSSTSASLGGTFYSFSGPIKATTSVLHLAVPSSYTVLASSSVTNLPRYAGGPVTLAAGGTTSITLNNGPILSGRVLVNGSPIGLNTTATIGGQSWSVQGSLGAQMTAPTPTPAVSKGWSATTGDFAERYPAGTYRVRINLRLTGTGPNNTGRVLSIDDLRPGTVLNNDLNLGTIDYQLVDHTLTLVNADGSAGSGYVFANTVGQVNPTTNLTTAGIFYSFNGQVTNSFTTPALAGSLNANVFPSNDTTVLPYLSTLITAAAGTTSTLTLNNGPVVRGRMLMNGQPVESSIVLGGNTWLTQGSGMSFQPVGTTATPLATGLGLVGSASRRIPAGTHLVRAYINLSGAAGSPVAGKTLQFIKIIDNQAITTDVDLGDIDFQTVDHTVRLVNRDSSAGSGNVQLTNLAGNAGAPGPYVSFRGEVTGSFVIPLLVVPAQLTVRTPLTSAAILSSTSITPSAGGLTTVVLGGAANVVVGAGDDDGDGILDLLEASAPNQDVDGNGVLDHQQKNIASLPVAGNSGEYVSIAVDNTKTLTEVSTAPISSAAVAPPAGTTFPSGLVKFTIPVVPASSDVTVRIYLAPAIAAQLSGYAKYNATTQLWTQMPADRVTINAAAGSLEVRLTDNGIGDDDPTVGKISDPGAPLIGSIARKTGSAAPVASAPLVFAPIPVATASTTAAPVSPAAAPAVPAATPSTTIPVTVPASVLVQTTPIPAAPAPAALPVETIEPAYTGSTPAPLVAAALAFLLLGYLMFWATSHKGKASLQRLANQRDTRIAQMKQEKP